MKDGTDNKCYLKPALKRLKKKGGTFHGSIRRGVVVHVKGEEPIQFVKPVPG